MPDKKVMPDVTAFLERLRVGEDGRGSVTLVVDDNAIADVTGSIELDISAHDAAHALVTAAHEYAERHRSRTHSADCWRWHPECAVAMIERWLLVIAMAREFGAETWERTADFLAGLWWAKGTVMEDMCRAIAAALKEGNADG